VAELVGCDLLTIAPKVLVQLQEAEGELPRKLDAEAAKALPMEKITVDKEAFHTMLAADRMADEKLTEGIEGFSTALADLEKQLAKRLAELESRAPAAV
jgi:transaldolase